MSMIFVDGVSHYTDSWLAKKWDVRSANAGGGTITQGLTSGRFGRGGITFVSGASEIGGAYPLYIQKNYNGVSTIIMGVAVQQTATQNVLGGRLLTFVDGSTTQVGLNIMQSGQIQAVRSVAAGTGIVLRGLDQGANSQTALLGMSTSAISSSSDDFLEVKIIHATGTSGSIEIRRNGEPFWTLTGINTAISGSANSSSVCVGGYASVGVGAGSTTVHHEDLKAVISSVHLLNTTAGGAGDPVDFIGDRSWEPLFPLSDVTTDWTPNPGPDHFANVNSFNPPNLARDNNTANVGDIDTFDFESALGPPTASVIFSYTMLLSKDTGGAVGVTGTSHSGASDGDGTEFQVPNPAAFRQSFGFIDPNTSAPWTVAGFNAAVHGYKRTS
jgi:hypothetical protein